MERNLRYALFLGCTVQTEQYGYEASVREVLPRLGVELVDIPKASCCGYPAFSSVASRGWIYLSARNLALVEELGLDVLALCNGCHLSFVEVKHLLNSNSQLKESINEILAIEGLKYSGKIGITHILELLHDSVGLAKLRESVNHPLSGLKLATHPGCHAIRPSKLGRPDDAENPQKLDRLILTIGAETTDYPEKVDCCGSSLAMTSGRTTLSIAGEKLRAVKEHGFDGLVTTCPFCFKVFDGRQRAIGAAIGDRKLEVPVFYYTQLLGLSMGLKPERLGLELNQSPIDSALSKAMGGGKQ